MKRSGNATAFVEKVRYLDKEGRASIPLVLMLVILYQMRGYVAGIISLTFSEDRTRLLNLFYSNAEQFGLMLLVGLPSLLVLLASAFAAEDDRNWGNRVMAIAQPLLLFSLFLDAFLIAWLFIEHQGHFSFGRAGIIMGWFISLWYLLKSRHWRFYRNHLATREKMV
ncbi:DUF2919 domain-containing protein [Idiomarina sp. OT37-5b]|uniref:DUF2919 domain-containing protein n=1 Tax=Idiomarina aquatica TaxID=1327752 RepID=A0AA94ED63_9GAMM|nr:MULTISPECIES: DUF2919 family protein [Idiomarina]AVJ56406.1 DUF2919 domain-containing protein [Idiomarina sp. OT37-5b]RUO39939.1 DUF2919 domain-containing protein [Idiomarina aquatica]